MGHLTRTMYGLHDRSCSRSSAIPWPRRTAPPIAGTIESSCEHFADIHDIPRREEPSGSSQRDRHHGRSDGYTEGNRMAITAFARRPSSSAFLPLSRLERGRLRDYMLTDRVSRHTADQHTNTGNWYTCQLLSAERLDAEVDESPMTRAESPPRRCLRLQLLQQPLQDRAVYLRSVDAHPAPVPKGVLW